MRHSNEGSKLLLFSLPLSLPWPCVFIWTFHSKKRNRLPPDSHCRCGALSVLTLTALHPPPLTLTHTFALLSLFSSLAGSARPQDSLAAPTSSSRIAAEWASFLWRICVSGQLVHSHNSCHCWITLHGARLTCILSLWKLCGGSTPDLPTPGARQACAVINTLLKGAVMLFSHG